jgi:phenylacetate-CoA ligase
VIEYFIDPLMIARKRRRREYREICHIKTPSELLSYQESHLTALLLHAYNNVPYYHRVFNEIELVQRGKVDLSKFDHIPVLTKDMLRRFGSELISKDHNARHPFYDKSGGSTGEPVRFMQDRGLLRWMAATWYFYHRDMLGIEEPSAKKILLWGSEKDLLQGTIGFKAKLKNWLTHTVALNSFRMEQEDIDRYVDKINSYKPDIVNGYAGSLFELCRRVEGENIKLYSPKIILSAAETLHNNMRDVIESSFGSSVSNFYGSREAPCMAAECRNGSMHVFSFMHNLEVLNDDNRPVKNGEEGKVVVTTLHNYSMPLIRYEMGDTAIQGDSGCSCRSVLPTLQQVTGRIVDHFVKEDGTTVPGEFFIHLIGVVCNKGVIKKFRVIQEDTSKIRILLVPEKPLASSFTEDINRKIRKVMGNCDIVWDVVDDIEKSPSGKYVYTRSLVHRETN